MDIPGSIGAAPGSGDGGESDENWRLLAGLAQERRRREVAPVGIAGESPMSTSTPCVNGTFRNLQADIVLVIHVFFSLA